MRKTLLALETSGRSGSVAILRAESTVTATSSTATSSTAISGPAISITTELLDPQWGSARTLTPAIDRLLCRLELRPSSLDCIALIQGPGSFTGLRVGVATAKAMAYALRIPIVAVDGLDTIALQIAESRSSSQPFPLLAVVDAYRGQAFVALYFIDDCGVRCVRSTYVEDHQAIANQVSDWMVAEGWSGSASQRFVVAGPGVEKLKKSWQGIQETLVLGVDRIEWMSDSVSIPMADTVAKLGWDRWILQGQTEDVFGFLPRYYRSSAAEDKLR
jgi:tRNA threonylcarbamoyladenosine biosynthesis protein TsaB